jgi:hypothetical protein
MVHTEPNKPGLTQRHKEAGTLVKRRSFLVSCSFVVRKIQSSYNDRVRVHRDNRGEHYKKIHNISI